MTVADVNGDQKPDVVAVTEDAVVWYENPSWAQHDIIRKATARDNVCIQPHDIDGDGRIDFALGAGWRPPDTKNPSTLQWLGRDAEGRWQVHPIRYDEPTLHRLRWGSVKGGGGQEATGRRRLARPRHQGPELGGRRGRARPRLRRPREAGRRELAVGGRRPLAAHDPQPPAHRPERRPARRDRAGRLGGRLRARARHRRALDQDARRQRQPGVAARPRDRARSRSAACRGGGSYIATIEPWHGYPGRGLHAPGVDGRSRPAAPGTARSGRAR